MTSIKLMLNCQRINKDGSYPLVFQIIRNRKKKLIYTSLRLLKEEFNSEKESIVIRKKNSSRFNYLRSARQILKTQKEALFEIRDYLDNYSAQYTAEDLVAKYKKQNDMQKPAAFVDAEITRLKKEGRDGTANNYKSLYNAVNRFMNGQDLLFTDIDFLWVKNFESYLRSRNLKRNTLSFYLRIARTLYTRAIKEKLVPESVNPFRDINLKEEETVKKAVNKDIIKRIANADLSSQGAVVQLARDIFMFSFYTRGMSFVDMARLRKSDISGDTLRYRRQKTGQLLQMNVEKPLKELMSKYDNPSIYVLPLLVSGDSYEQYRYVQRRMNKSVRKLGEILMLSIPLTFYIARHSWATLARREGVPLPVISECMGHTSESTTRIYLAQLDQDEIDKANRRVIELD